MAATGLSATAVNDIIDYLCHAGGHFKIYYLWRPTLKDPKDDMVLELAVTSGAGIILTYNKAHFAEGKRFGIKVMTPKELLKQMGELQ